MTTTEVTWTFMPCTDTSNPWQTVIDEGLLKLVATVPDVEDVLDYVADAMGDVVVSLTPLDERGWMGPERMVASRTWWVSGHDGNDRTVEFCEMIEREVDAFADAIMAKSLDDLRAWLAEQDGKHVAVDLCDGCAEEEDK